MDTTHGDDVMTFESDLTSSARQTHKEYSHTIYIESFPDVRAAAGDGQVIGTPTDQISVSVAINAAEWRRYVGLNPVHIKMITAHGDSMFPTIKHGDNVLVDTETHRFIDDAVYAIVHDGYIRIKRIQLRLDGSIVVKSDNKHYNNGEPEIYKPGEYDNFNILGKVLPFKFGSFEL